VSDYEGGDEEEILGLLHDGEASYRPEGGGGTDPGAVEQPELDSELFPGSRGGRRRLPLVGPACRSDIETVSRPGA
jgi:hypothetical protein